MMKRAWITVLGVVAVFMGISTGYAQDWGMVDYNKTFKAPSGKSLEILLDVDAGEVTVEPGRSADEVVVQMRYAEGEFIEDVDFDERRGRLKIKLDSKRWKKWRSYDSDEDGQASVIVSLPFNVELYLSSSVSAGKIEMELGGLRLKEFSLTNFAGEVEVSFDEPNKIVMDMLDINAKVGETRFLSLGNARFMRADINAGIGEMEVDFTGALEQGSRAKVDLDIGSATVIFPEDFGVRTHIGGGLSFLSSKDIDNGFRKRGSAFINDSYEDDESALLVRISPGLGELNVRLE